MMISDYCPETVLKKFHILNYRHAAEIITQAFPKEWDDLMFMFSNLSIKQKELTSFGGSETDIPGKFEEVLLPRGWKRYLITADVTYRFYERKIDQKQYEDFPSKENTVKDYISGPRVDYMKSRVAMCLEWNKKDVSFDRVLTSLRIFHEYNLISAGIIVTRAEDMTEVFKELNIAKKYGSSSTHIDRLIPRIETGEAGTCPLLIAGIRKSCVEGYE